MPHSVLVYRDLPAASGHSRASLVMLHDYRGDHDSLLPLAGSFGPDVHVVLPAAARGVYQFRDVVGQTWFGGRRLERPEPSSFGDSLAQMERFLHDVIERNGPEVPRPYVLGLQQGAVVALALATIAPDLMSGVIAIGGCLPTFSDSTLLPAVPADLPALLISDPGAGDMLPATVETEARLSQLGYQVTALAIPRAQELETAVSEAVAGWLSDRIGAR